MKYDDASWHSGGEFPEDSPPEYGATHIALFLKWCFLKGWAGELFTEEAPEELQEIIDGKISATEFFLDFCDGKFISDFLNDEGNQFAEQYYGRNGLYLLDYEQHFGDLMYVKPEKDHDFDKFSEMLEKRYQSGILTTDQK